MRAILLGVVSVSIWAQSIDGALLRYLQLSEQQAQEIMANAARFAAEQKPIYERVNTLNREIESETRRAAPDKGALGTRYREIELLCRDSETPRRGLYERQMALLSASQRERMQAIEGSDQMAVLAWQAEGFNLLPPLEGRAEANVFPGLLRGWGWAEMGPLREYLRLSEAQGKQIEEKTRSHVSFQMERQARMSEVRAEIEAEFGLAAPGAAELGERYWELEAHRRQIAAREAELRREMDAILTAEQRGQVAELARARDAYALKLSAALWGLTRPGDIPMPASRPPYSLLGVPAIRDPLPGGAVGAFVSLAGDGVARNCLYGPEYVPLPITRVRTGR